MIRANWKQCEPQPSGKAAWVGLYVTLNPQGYLVFGRHAIAALGKPSRIKVFYDSYNNRLGIQPSRDGVPKTCRLLKRGDHGGRMACIGSILVTEDIKIPETIRFYDARMDEDGFLILDLRTAKVPKSSVSRRAYWEAKKKAAGLSAR